MPALDERRLAARSGVARQLTAITPAVLVGVVLIFALPEAFDSLIVAILLGGALGLVALVLVLGLEGAATLVLMVAVALAPLNDVRPIAAVTFVTFSDVLLVLGFGLLTPLLLVRPLRIPAAWLVGAVGVTLVGLVSSVLSPDPALSLNHMLRLVVGAFGLTVLFVAWRPGPRTVAGLASAYLVGNAANAVAAVLRGPDFGDGRHQGLSSHVNVMGLCAMLGLALVPYLLEVVPRWSRPIVLALAAASAYGIWLSGSRAALVVAVAVVLIYPVLARSIEAAIALFGAGIVATYAAGRLIEQGAGGTNVLGRLLGGGSAAGSDAAREAAAQAAIDQFSAHPVIGGGFGEVLEAHNIYLQIGAAVGAIGLLLYLVMLFAVIRPAYVARAPYHLLALPAMAYAMVGLITPLLWDRYIWCVLPLSLLTPLRDPDEAAPALEEQTT